MKEVKERITAIDATLVLAMIFPDESSSEAVEIFEQHLSGGLELIAPDLICLEVLNACLAALRRGRISEDLYQRLVSAISRLDIRVVRNQLPLVDALARKHGLSAYEAAYLAVAVQEKCPLATLDEKLKNAAVADAEVQGFPG